MKKLFGITFLLLVFVAPVLAQEHRLSPEDQGRFDSYYSRWQQYRQTNDRGQIASMEVRMFDIYARYGIPREVPYERVASNGGEFHDDHDRDHDRYRDHDQDRDYDRDRDHDRDHDAGRGYDRWRRTLPGDDQRRFDSYFSRWQQYRQNHDRDQIDSMERRMNDLMARDGIPAGTPYWRVASNVDWHGWVRWSRQLSPEDQGRFDSYYSRWLDYRQRRDWDQVRSMEGRMEDVMAHYNIPRDVPYDVIASQR
ncbi:MAG TPA: hypothetical protein VFA74_13750 [Terriglobales bacterium]|nr:hypothetical protein [Terriglobales bacterium]